MHSNGLFIIHAVATFYLVGLIWMVQRVHYPLMDRVGDKEFTRYESDHGRLITPIVAPMMIIELITGALLVAGAGPAWIPTWAAWSGLAAVIGIWCSTFFLQVPYHTILLRGFDIEAHRALVLTNWIRTVLWTWRGLLIAFLLWRALQGSAVTPLESR